MLLKDEKSGFTEWIQSLSNEYKIYFEIYDKGNRRVKLGRPETAGFLIDVYRYNFYKIINR